MHPTKLGTTRKYDSTLARMAGNIAAGLVTERGYSTPEALAHDAIAFAKAIIKQLEFEQATDEANG